MTSVVHKPIKHDSAAKHVAGTARYIDDLPEPEGLLHAALHLSERTHAKILSIDTSAALALPGVIAAITVDDVPGDPDIAPVVRGEPMLANGVVEFHGQPVVAIAAIDLPTARRAARLVKVEYEDLPAILSIADAIEQQSFLLPPLGLKRGDAAAAIAKAPHRLKGELNIGGQDHFYLEDRPAWLSPAKTAM